MAHRTVLTERQRSALFDLPTDRTVMLRHYTLADDDLEIIRARRRPHNRFGFALQLCALRYPGRLLTPGEVIPLEVTRFLGATWAESGRSGGICKPGRNAPRTPGCPAGSL